ncbi:hypothetical protein [Actinoplanes sp. NPDC048796]|uniref:hypothetical protein n=1 Tax=unclassified Actinoplanes TaxID=2626549 RepID=UPI0033E5CC73
MADTTSRRILRQVVVRLDAPARALSTAMRRGPALTTRFAEVLDGRTVNLDIPVPGVAAADITGAELRLSRGRVRHTVAARVRADAGGSALAATALLSGHARGLGLAPGSPWLLEAVLHTRAGTTSYAVLRGPEDARRDGPTVLAPADPATGRRYELRTTRSGRLGVAVVAPAPTAEVTSVTVDWLRARFDVRLLGCAEPVTGFELTARTGEGRVRAAAVPVGDVLRCEVPVYDLAALSKVTETFFDVHLRTAGHRLRVGRFLHDVGNPKPVLVPPHGIVWAAPGLSVNLRPYYTPAGSLTLACRPIGSPSSANGQP